MKNTFYLAVVFCSVLCSCSKDQVIHPQNAESQRKLAQLSQMDLSDRIIAFNMLTPDERYEAVYQKTERLLKSSTFSREQANLINEMKNNLKPELYKEGSEDSREVNMNTFATPWLEKAKREFTKEQVYDIAFTLASLKKDASRTTRSTSNARERASCHCHIGSAFTCPRVTIGLDPDITFDHCGGGDCIASEWGCGFNLFWGCNGNVCG